MQVNAPDHGQRLDSLTDSLQIFGPGEPITEHPNPLQTNLLPQTAYTTHRFQTSWGGFSHYQQGINTADGGYRLIGLVVTMPEQQVYVDGLVTTPRPWIALSGVYVSEQKDSPISHLPW